MFAYPRYNQESFLHYFDRRIKSEKPDLRLKYFALLFDEIGGQDYSVYEEKINLIDRIDQDKNYFTITELMTPPLPRNIITFGPTGRVAIPYIATFPYLQAVPFQERKYNTWFAGTINCGREKLYESSLIDLHQYSPDEYFKKLSNTKFALCPEGCDALTYRFAESIHCGCIPVYISNKHVLPFAELINYQSFCICITWDEVADLHRIISKFDVQKALESLVEIKQMFTYDFTYNYIINYLRK